MISPGWAAAFASPPAALALAMIAAGAGGGEATGPATTAHLKLDSTSLDKKSKLHSFSSFREPIETVSKPSTVKGKASTKAAALAAARDVERTANIGSGRGLSAVAMATAAQRRNRSDTDRVKRWNVFEAMASAWTECLPSADNKQVYKKDFNALSYKFIVVLVGSLALARNLQRSEIFFQMGKLTHMIYVGISALVFYGYIVFDTFNLIEVYIYDDYILAAIALYLDILNLFLALLNLFSDGDDGC